MNWTLLLMLIFAAINAACVRPERSAPADGESCIQDFDPATDYFPEKVTVGHASNFSVAYHQHYKLVTVKQAGGRPPIVYVLVQCGAPLPADIPSTSITVPIPITSLYASTVGHAALLEELDRLEVLAGVANAQYVTSDEVLSRIHSGQIVEYSRNDVVNAELIIGKEPSAVMVSGLDDAANTVIQDAGIPIILNSEWLETTALGRAEWLKFMALFVNEDQRAQERFDAIERRYLALAQRTAEIPKNNRVRVTTGTAFRGVYTVAGGRSYAAGLIADAGGDYVWADNEDVGSATIDVEQQIHRAANADVWINGGDWTSLEDMIAEDLRYSEFKAYRTAQVWTYNRRQTSNGGNDYWSRGVTRPDLILADLIKIFYPDRARDHEFEWYRQLTPSK